MATSSGSRQSLCCLLFPRQPVVRSTHSSQSWSPCRSVTLSALPSLHGSCLFLRGPSIRWSPFGCPLTLLACLDGFVSSLRVSCHCCMGDFEIQPRHRPLVGVTSPTLRHLPLEVLEPPRLFSPSPLAATCHSSVSRIPSCSGLRT